MSDWYQLENHVLTIQVRTKGAELKRLFNKVWNRELLWNGDEKIWNRSSPILFPIIGKLKDDEYFLNNQLYSMSQHGFARDSEFKCSKCEHDYLEFTLVANEESLKKYPFMFELTVTYKLIGNELKISNIVKNKDKKVMLFNIGGHPAFRSSPFNNYFLQFEKKESQYFQTQNGIIDLNKPIPFSTKTLLIQADTFKKDALVFQNIRSSYVDFIDRRKKEMIRIKDFECDFFSIWSKDDISFVCLEPWSGVCDEVRHDKNFENKLGIQKLNPGEIYDFYYSIECNLWTEDIK